MSKIIGCPNQLHVKIMEESWSDHQKTIQNNVQQIEELKSQLEFKDVCLRAALADLQNMDRKLQSEQNRSILLEQELKKKHGYEFGNTGVESPFMYE